MGLWYSISGVLALLLLVVLGVGGLGLYSVFSIFLPYLVVHGMDLILQRDYLLLHVLLFPGQPAPSEKESHSPANNQPDNRV